MTTQTSGTTQLKGNTGLRADVEQKTTGENALHTIAETTIVSNSSDAPGCPVYSPKYRVDKNFNTVTLPDSASPFQSIYLYNGSGKLSTFYIRFDSNDTQVQFKIDGVVSFDMQMNELEHFTSSSDQTAAYIDHSWAGSKKAYLFRPKCPIEFTTSIEFLAKGTSGSKKVEGYIATLTKES